MKTDITVDALVVGSGIAGLSSALALADAGFEVVVITAAAQSVEANTTYAQGGIIFESREGDPESLVADILEAGCHRNHLPAVQKLATEGPALVRSILLDRAGVEFDRAAGPDTLEYHLTREGAHSRARILHRGDESGRSIEQSLYQLCLRSNVKFLTQATAINLLMTSYHPQEQELLHEPARCFGAFVYDQTNREVFAIRAHHTVLATGGVGQLFLHNTNAKFARGDGIALAHRAGCRIESLEYVQFHPTTFYHPKAKRFLISEALRGEGAILLNQAGERFLKNYLPDLEVPELGPRDRVVKAIHQELLTSGASSVFLDLSFKPADWIRDRFPFVYRNCLNHGVDITREPIPVVPGAHYLCGGVWSGLKGETSVASLWAVGEVAHTGLHGANRLASTSLLEGLVWGTSAGRAIAEDLKQRSPTWLPQIDPWEQGSVPVDPSFLRQDWLMLKHTMWNYVGILKTEARLSRAQGILGELCRGIDVFYQKAMLSDELIGLRHATLVASLMLEACRLNRKSLGCYLREDREI